ncbi:MAG: hypothetical protein D6718_01480 [Acidobacteria bacterium]|nr:MAG: hypothetical protein D6718_01480 [Acidobacteriota bacterium]
MAGLIPSSTFARAADPLLVTDAGGRVRYINEPAAPLAARSRSDALGRPCWEVMRLRRDDGTPLCRPDCEVLAAARAGRPAPRMRVLAVTSQRPVPHELVTVLHPSAARHAPAVVHLLLPSRRPAAAEAGTDIRAASRLTLLSPRERDVLRLLASGYTTDQIASALHIARTTVRNHVRAILGKLRVHRRVEAVLIWLRAGGAVAGLPRAADWPAGEPQTAAFLPRDAT